MFNHVVRRTNRMLFHILAALVCLIYLGAMFWAPSWKGPSVSPPINFCCYLFCLLHVRSFAVVRIFNFKQPVPYWEHFVILNHVVRRTNRRLSHMFDALMFFSDYYGSLVWRTHHMLFHIVAAFIDVGRKSNRPYHLPVCCVLSTSWFSVMSSDARIVCHFICLMHLCSVWIIMALWSDARIICYFI